MLMAKSKNPDDGVRTYYSDYDKRAKKMLNLFIRTNTIVKEKKFKGPITNQNKSNGYIIFLIKITLMHKLKFKIILLIKLYNICVHK